MADFSKIGSGHYGFGLKALSASGKEIAFQDWPIGMQAQLFVPDSVFREHVEQLQLAYRAFAQTALAKAVAQLHALQSGSIEQSGTGVIAVAQATSTQLQDEQRRYHELQRKYDEAQIRIGNLQTRVKQERQTAALARHDYDQLLTNFAGVQESLRLVSRELRDRSAVNDELARLISAKQGEQLLMFEEHDGTVMHVDEKGVEVTYEIDDEYVDQRYNVEQFLNKKCPKKGDKVTIYVLVASVPEGQKSSADVRDSANANQSKPLKPAQPAPREL